MLKKFENNTDDRTLVVVTLCPCCTDDEILHIENAVLVCLSVSPNPIRRTMHCVDKLPPIQDRDDISPEEADTIPNLDKFSSTNQEYLSFLENFIDQILLEK